MARPLGVAGQQRWLFSVLLAQGGEFAFVVFGVARTARVLPGEWDALLTLTVALSMALTPALFFIHDRWLSPPPAAKPVHDTMPEEQAPVIIAGFGRFGQIVGRLLFASGIKATVLDHDPDQIETLRRFDFKIYYGDATRLDLLEAAGAARARLLVVAIDDPTMSLHLVDAVREHYPELAIVARARNVGHFQELRRRGVQVVERETFESAVALGRSALELLGVRPYEARERADAFRRHNLKMLDDILPHWDDIAQRTNLARSAREQLERQMQQERDGLTHEETRGWHSEGDR